MALRGLKNILSLRREAEKQSAALPALIMQAERIAASLTHGEHARRKSGTGQKFWQFRDYVTGDRPQDIDWRQSAKTDHVFIRQKELETTQKTFFWCASDHGMRYASNPDLSTKQDCAVIFCLTIALMLMRAEEQIGVFGDTKTGRSENRLERITQSLIDSSRQESLPRADNFLLPRHSFLVMAGDFLRPIDEITATFAKLAAHAEHCLVIQILDPAEIALDFSGRVRFEGLSESEKEIINHIPSIRAEYQSRIQAQIDGVKNLCKQNNWLYILHRTDDDLCAAMAALWEISAAETSRGMRR